MTNFFPNRLVADDPLLDRLRSSTLGLYDVAGEIGRGGMAVVYIATDMRLGRKVAIKVMEPRLNFTPGMAERFLQEAQIAAQLQHHNIIVVHEVRQDEELIFFVMRLVEGGSLDEVCRRLTQKERQLPIDQAQWILWQSARALAYAHSEGFVHRDVKPANILISTKGEVVVTDFGIARAVDAEGLTKSGMAIGTPTYMSPEQFVGLDTLSGATDQYALGIAAYEMLTGSPPFTGDLYRIIAAHGSAPVPDLRERRPDCPPALANAVMRMLEKKPSDRWPSLDAVLPVLATGLSIDGSATRDDLAKVATELQAARAASVFAWSALTPVTPSWGSGSSRRNKPEKRVPDAVTVPPPNEGKDKAAKEERDVTPPVASVKADEHLKQKPSLDSEAGAANVASASKPDAPPKVKVSGGRFSTRSAPAVVDAVSLASSAPDAVPTVDPGAAVDRHASGAPVASGAPRTSDASSSSKAAGASEASVAPASPAASVAPVASVAPLASLAPSPTVPAAAAIAIKTSSAHMVQNRRKGVVAGAVVLVLCAIVLMYRQSRAKDQSGGSTIAAAPATSPNKALPTDAAQKADSPNLKATTPEKTPGSSSGLKNGDPDQRVPQTGASTSGGTSNSAAQKTPPPPSGLGRAGAVAGTVIIPDPLPPVAKPDSVAERAATPSKPPEATAPGDAEMRRLSREYVLRLDRGEFRTGSLASFFSSATSSHHVTMIGEAHSAGRQADALLVDVDLQLERTLGSGAVQRRTTTVRLVLRGRGGSAVIEGATAGPLANAR